MKTIQITQYQPQSPKTSNNAEKYAKVSHSDILELGLLSYLSTESKISLENVYLSSNDLQHFIEAAKSTNVSVQVDEQVKLLRYFPDIADYNPALVGLNVSPGQILKVDNEESIVVGIQNMNTSSKVVVVEPLDTSGDQKIGNERYMLAITFLNHVNVSSLDTEKVLANQMNLSIQGEDYSPYKSQEVTPLPITQPTQTQAKSNDVPSPS